jgi:hypothetical protein
LSLMDLIRGGWEVFELTAEVEVGGSALDEGKVGSIGEVGLRVPTSGPGAGEPDGGVRAAGVDAAERVANLPMVDEPCTEAEGSIDD